MELLKDLWGYLKVRKKFWLLPLIIVLLLIGLLVVLSSSSAIDRLFTQFFSLETI